MSSEAVARVAYFKGLKAVLARLPPKLVEIDSEVPVEAEEGESAAGEGMGPRVERVRTSIQAATFTGKGDKEVVVKLYNDYIAHIGNAMYNSAGKAMARRFGSVFGNAPSPLVDGPFL